MTLDEKKIRLQLESRNQYELHAVQTLYDSKSERFYFLVYDTVLLHSEGETAEYMKNLDEASVLKYFRETILPKL